MAPQSHVRVSFDQPLYTADVVGLGSLRLLEAVRHLNLSKPVKFYQASSSEMYGSAPPPQGLDTPFHPRSPYACAKLYAHWQTINYREAYGLFALLGHSVQPREPAPRRVVRHPQGHPGRHANQGRLQKKLVMGNLDAKRDWGFAGDYVRAMWLMLQQEKPDDYVVATGETHSVRELLELAFSYVDLDYRDFVEFDTEVHPAVGGRRPPGRRVQDARDPRLEARSRFSRPGEDDDRSRPRAGPPREIRQLLSEQINAHSSRTAG